MAVRRTFGKTWWGNIWVEAMERIDYNTNRLPRGRTYARNGNVLDIDIENGQVLAKVQGSRPRPYDVKINLKKFSPKEIAKIKEIIASNPAIASELSLGKLPESLLSILEMEKLFILPQSWDDISADCSCPDWANPCKHLAAVYYILANEIDKNPFLIFNLRGVSTEELVEAAGLSTEEKIQEMNEKKLFIPLNQVKIETPTRTEPSFEPDFSFESLDVDSLFSLLPESPLFYPHGDFKKILLNVYKRVIKNIETMDIMEDYDSSIRELDFYCVFKNLIDFDFFITSSKSSIELYRKIIEKFYIPGGKSYSIKIPIISTNLDFVSKKGIKAPSDEVFNLFLKLPLETIDKSSPSFRFLSIAHSFALALIKSGNFIPEVVTESDMSFYIRYTPIIGDEKTKPLMEYLKSIMSLNFGFRTQDNSIFSKDGINDFISLIITHIIREFTDISKLDCFSEDGIRICKTFFTGSRYIVRRFEEKQTARAISNWLERLSIRKKDISPVIKIEIPSEGKFELNIEVENKKDPLALLVPIGEIFSSKKEIFSYPVDVVRTDISRQISIASEYTPSLRDILNSRGKKKVYITPLEMASFITSTSMVLNLLGIRISIPRELAKILIPQISLKAKIKDSSRAVSYLSLDEILNFSWEIAIGDTTISKEEFLKLAKSAKGIVKFKEQYILLNPEEMKNLLDKVNKPTPKLSSMEIIHTLLIDEYKGIPISSEKELQKLLENILKVEDIDLPRDLNGKLRPYQERGFKWLYSNFRKGLGLCIADDMGLGKTIQVISFILKLKEEKRLKNPVLVVCPTTLVGNWQKECQKFAPTLNVSIYYGSERRLILKNKDVVITTYGILRRDLEKFKDIKWELLIIDEAQNIKNPSTEQTKAVKSLNASSYIAMSGTPVENRLTELWSIFDFTIRGYLWNLSKFTRDYAIPIERYRDKNQIEKLKKITAPFLLRRLKIDKTIINDLPEKIIFDEYCYLAKEQTALYQEVVERGLKEIEEKEGIERKGLIFKLITSLKQICNHPVHYLKRGNPTKELSGKAEKTIEILEKTLDINEKALIFTQYKEMGEILLDIIKNELGEEALFFHGELPRTKRDKIIMEFQENDSKKLMIISLKAGGVGLNLTSATNVIHYDLWWNPAVEEQATDRTYRIGQTRNVTVHRLITIGTFEEKIDEMIKRKKELADLTVSVGEH